MGRATVISGGTDGRYVIEMDYGLAQRDARVAKLDATLDVLAVRKAWQQDEVDKFQGGLDTFQGEVNPLIDAYRAALELVPPVPGQAEGIRKQLDTLTQDIVKQQLWLAQAKAALAHTDLEIQQLTLDRAALMALQITEQRPAWCADLTEEATGAVATIDVPGESSLILIYPGALAPDASDGVLTAREIQSPAQCFWNAAVLPGWQKFLPTYRWGTITALDTTADTASVALAAATSSAQGLDVNQATTLAGVPVQYMECNASAFVVGDNVIVEFAGQDWAQPIVIGFLDTPRACGAVNFTCIPAATTGETWGWTAPLTTEGGAPINGGKGTVATQTNRSYSAVHVPIKPVEAGLEFVTTKIKRAQQNSYPPNEPTVDGFYNSDLSSTDYAGTPEGNYNTYGEATANLTSSLHAIAREWVSPDRKMVVTTALGDVMVNGISKGNPASGAIAAWACVMNKATPTPENPTLTTRYLALWTWSAPLISVYTRPLIGGDWAFAASKSVVDYDPDAMDGSYFEDNPIEELDPQTCWLRKGARNASGTVCSMWAQTPRYWRFTNLGEANIWAWVLDFDIDTGALTDTQMTTETVAQVGPPAPLEVDGSITQSGTRNIDFEYVGDAKEFTVLTFSGGYAWTAEYVDFQWVYTTTQDNLRIVLSKGDYTLTVYDSTPGAITAVSLWYYGNGAICFKRESGNETAPARAFRIEFPGSSLPGVDLIAPAASASPAINLDRGGPFTGTQTGTTSDTPWLNASMQWLEYKHYRALTFAKRDRSALNFRVLDDTYLISIPNLTFGSGGYGLRNGILIDCTGFTTWCSDPALFTHYGIDAEAGVLKHIKLA